MNSSFKKTNHLFNKYIAIFAILLSVVSVFSTICCSFFNSYLPETISNDIDFQYNKTKQKVEMNITQTLQTSFSWFKNNDSAVQEMGTIHRNNSVFMRYNPINFNRITSVDSEDSLVGNHTDSEALSLFGNANTRLGIIPYSFSVIAGKYDNSDFQAIKNIPIDEACNTVISQSFADLLIENGFSDSYQNMINKEFKDKTSSKRFIIRCVVKDKCLMTGEKPSYFIFSSFLTFSTFYEAETLVFLFSNNKYTNYSLILYTLYYIYKPSTSNVFTLSFPNNEWIEQDFFHLYNNYQPNKILMILNCILSFVIPIILGFYYRKTYKNHGLKPLQVLLIAFLFLAFKSIFNFLLNCVPLFNLHINMYIGAGYFYEIIILVVFILSSTIFSKPKLEEPEEPKNLNDFYSIDL